MCRVTSTELKNNLSYYLELSSREDVLVTKNGKVISVITNPNDKNFSDFMKLEGCLSKFDKGQKYDDLLKEEITKKCGF